MSVYGRLLGTIGDYIGQYYSIVLYGFGYATMPVIMIFAFSLTTFDNAVSKALSYGAIIP